MPQRSRQKSKLLADPSKSSSFDGQLASGIHAQAIRFQEAQPNKTADRCCFRCGKGVGEGPSNNRFRLGMLENASFFRLEGKDASAGAKIRPKLPVWGLRAGIIVLISSPDRFPIRVFVS